MLGAVCSHLLIKAMQTEVFVLSAVFIVDQTLYKKHCVSLSQCVVVLVCRHSALQISCTDKGNIPYTHSKAYF